MTTRRPIAVRPAIDRRHLCAVDTKDSARCEREIERDAALWLYAWSYDALRPTGEHLAARLTSPPVFRPGKRVGRIPRHSRRQRKSHD